MAVKNADLSWKSQPQARGLHLPSLPCFGESTSLASEQGFVFPTLFVFLTSLLVHFLLCVDMAGSKNKFADVACATRKGKAVVGMSAPPPKCAHRFEEIIMLPAPPPFLQPKNRLLLQVFHEG